MALSLAVVVNGTSSLQAEEQNLPELGSEAGSYMTPAQEKRLGQAFLRSVKSSQTMLDEPFAKIYIEQLGRTLVANSTDQTGKSFNFFLLDNPQINAFAGPDGHIGVYTGLIQTTDSESELAAVVAHEIAHVTQNHLMRAFNQASQMSLPSAAVLLAAVVLGATVGGDAAIATAVGGQAALLQQQINFTRSNEQEADRIGIQTLSGAEFEPNAMPVFFERMGRANRAYASELPEFLRTHPVTTNRIADSMARAEQHPYRQHQSSLTYYLLKAYLKEKSFIKASESEKFFATNLSEGRYRNRTAQQFGLYLSYMRQHEFAKAGKVLDEALKSNPLEPALLVSQARLLEKTGKLKQAVELLDDSLTLLPGDYPLTMQLADYLIQAGNYDRAISQLEGQLQLRAEDDAIYRVIARAYGAKGDRVSTHSYQADYLYLNGQLEPAIQQLEIALEQKPLDFYQASRLEARLKAMRDEFEIVKKNDK